jgi:hypothetical protein
MFMVMNLPFSNANHSQLRKVFQMLRCSVDIPCGDRLRKDLTIKAEGLRAHIKDMLKKVRHVSIALDGWTSPNHLAFMAIVAYFITKDWKYESALLAFEQLSGAHIGRSLAEMVDGKAKEFAIQDKMFAITTDNAGNMGTLASHLQDLCLQCVEDRQTEYELFHIPCLAHIINLAVQAFLEDIKAGAENEMLETVISTERIRRASTMSKGFNRTLTLVSIRKRFIRLKLSI